MRYLLLLVVPGLLSLVQLARAQVGVTICACQPDFYEFTFNFSLTCVDTDITPDMPGINDTACKTNPVGDQNVTDKTPVVVTQVQIFELGPPPTFEVLFETTISTSFGDAATFNYTSVSAHPEKITEANLPAGLQLSITGRNRNEEEIINYWLIVYDNDCGIWPLLTEGQKIGWTIFSSLGTPSQFICPVAPAESTNFPSDSPSQLPSSVTPVASLPTFKPSFAGPSSSKDVPTSAPNVLCPPVGDSDDGPPQSSKGTKKLPIKGSRALRVGPRTPAPSLCPEPSPTKPKPSPTKNSSKKAPSPKKKSKGESSPKAKSKGEPSPKAKSKGELSPKKKSKGEPSPKTKSKGELSPKAKSKGEHSPKKKSKGEPSPKHGMQMLSKPPTSGRARRKY